MIGNKRDRFKSKKRIQHVSRIKSVSSKTKFANASCRGIVALSIPMAIDQAIGADPAEPIVTTEEDGKEIVRRSLLGPRLACSFAASREALA